MNPCAICAVSMLLLTSAFSQCPKNADSCVTTVRTENGGTTTSTSYDNRAHAEAVGAATAALTAAGLTYFLVLRPAMQTAANERMNRREAHFTPTYEMLDALAASDVPGTSNKGSGFLALKGYYLGESWRDFSDSSPILHERLVKCKAEKRPESGKSRKKIDFNPCSSLWLLDDASNVDVTLDCLDSTMGPGKDMVCQDFNGEISFHSGKLVSLKMILPGDWLDIYPDIVAKFGEPVGQDRDKTLGVWNTKNTHLVAAGLDGETALSWTTLELYEAAMSREKNMPQIPEAIHKNSLDR